MSGVILALDLGKAKSVACWYQAGEEKHQFRTVRSSPADVHDLLVDRPVDRVVIEVSDMAGWIVDLCRSLGIAIEVANTNREAWNWKNVKDKCDRKDALKLARLCALGQLSLVHIPKRPVRQWRSLILYRHKLVERKGAIQNAIHAILVREAASISVDSQAWSGPWMAQLRSLAAPLGQCEIDQLWRGHLQIELANLDHLLEQIEQVEQRLNAIGQANAQVRRLQTIPGVGPRLSELVVAMLDDPHRFKNARQVSAYVGMVPRRYQSGQMEHTGKISKAGCRKLRKLLVEIAWGMLQHNPHGREVFARISRGQKTRRKQAAVALGRRVLVWCWAMLRDGSDWKVPQARSGVNRLTGEVAMRVT